jgi:phosphoribosyl-AMP cyclohydrolase
MDIERLFIKSELIPTIVIEDKTNEVLMLAYMNKESLKKTMEIGQTVFFSRSKQALWHKGETSGHFQNVVRITADCDEDTLLIRVNQIGVACHTGAYSCFFNEVWENEHE